MGGKPKSTSLQTDNVADSESLGRLLSVQSESLVSELIVFSAQLLLNELPLPTFFCFISWSVLVSLSSAYTAIGIVEEIPVNAAAVTIAAIADSFKFMFTYPHASDYILVEKLTAIASWEIHCTVSPSPII